MTSANMRMRIPDHLIDLSQTAFVFRYAVPGHEQPHADESFYRAAQTSVYIPATELAHSPRDPNDTVTKVVKAAITAEHKPFQIQVDDESFKKPLVRALISSLIYPPAEYLRFNVSLGAWVRQGLEALRIGQPTMPLVTDEIQRQTHLDMVSEQFASAIVLHLRD